MAIQGIPGATPFRLNPGFALEGAGPTVPLSTPQGGVAGGGNAKSGGGLQAGTKLSELKPEQRSALGGGSALEAIAQAQPETTVGELGPLLKNTSALDSIAGLMQQRRDLKVGDFISTDQKGRTRIDPSYKDPKVMDMLKERPDITPGELTAMQQNFTKTMKSPELGKIAAEKGFELLKKRTDLKPEDMSGMLSSFHQTVAGDPKKGKGGDEQAGAMAALDMFESASKLMEKRTDISPDRMGELARSVGSLSSAEDKNGPQSIAEGFDSASKSLEKNLLRSPEDMAKTASTIGDHFQGGDEKTAGHRMNAFKKSSDMMGDNQSVDHNSINKVLTQASERDPKIQQGEGAGRAKRLEKVMDDVSTGVKQGTVSGNDLSGHFRNQDAERARFQPQPENKTEKKKNDDSNADKPKNAEPGQVGVTTSSDKASTGVATTPGSGQTPIGIQPKKP